MNIIGILLAILPLVELANGMYNLTSSDMIRGGRIFSITNAMYKNGFHVVTF